MREKATQSGWPFSFERRVLCVSCAEEEEEEGALPPSPMATPPGYLNLGERAGALPVSAAGARGIAAARASALSTCPWVSR